MGYDDDIRLERKHSTTIAGILGKVFISQDAEMDWKHATDFAIFTVRPFTVAARLRTNGYLAKYGDQFTVRWSRPSGVDTEIHKIRRGDADYILYGFVSSDESSIVRYFIGDLDIFRSSEPEPIGIYPNNPPDSELAAYRLTQFTPSFVIKSWPNEWVAELKTVEAQVGAVSISTRTTVDNAQWQEPLLRAGHVPLRAHQVGVLVHDHAVLRGRYARRVRPARARDCIHWCSEER